MPDVRSFDQRWGGGAEIPDDRTPREDGQTWEDAGDTGLQGHGGKHTCVRSERERNQRDSMYVIKFKSFTYLYSLFESERLYIQL